MKRELIAVCSKDGDHEHARKHAEAMQSFWGQVSDGYWDVAAWPFALDEDLRDCNADREYCYANMREQWARLDDKPDEDPTRWLLLGGWQQGACGEALNTPSRVAVTFSGCPITTSAHECGHMFGLNHSNVFTEDGVVKAYKDKSSVMGSDSPMSLHPPNVYQLGLYNDDDVRVIISSGLYAVCPWEVPHIARHDHEKPINIISLPDTPLNHYNEAVGARGRYFISVRKTRGYPWIPKQNESGVYIHFANRYSWRYDRLLLGEESDRIPGVRVRHVESGPDVSVVKVTFK